MFVFGWRPALKRWSFPPRPHLHANMKQTLIQLSQQYVTTLEKHFLKQEARSKTSGLKNTIASTQRLVAKSAESVRQAGRKMGGL
jgi:hypothetical protein